MGSETILEYNVNLTCGKCEQAVAGALRSAGLTEFSISVAEERVVVVTDRHQDLVKETIEKTGKLAVLIGAGGGGGGGGVVGAAVAMLGVGGDFLSPGPKGVIRLTQIEGRGGGGGGCVIEGTVDGLSPGLHGLAIHETGDTSQGCLSLGGHYNPQGARHGSPDSSSEERHYGDLGNIKADQDGRARFRLVDKVVEVWEVIGRSVVVSAGQDDLGLGSELTSSLTDGNCGPGVACGVIARAAALGQNNKKICACDGVTIWDERNKPLTGEGRRNSNL